MATAKKPTTVRKTIAPLPDDPAVKAAFAGNSQSPNPDVSASDDEVDVMVVKGFKLTLDNFTQVDYVPGPQTMPRSHAEHWFAKAHGVTIKPSK